MLIQDTVRPENFLPASTVLTEEEFDPYIEARLGLEEVAVQLDLEDWIVQRLVHPEREITLHLPMVLANAQAAVFTAFRIQHSGVCGPMMGSVRLGPDIRQSQVKAWAMAATWQCALLDLPFGGSAGAIVCDAESLTERELLALASEYVHGLRESIGPLQDVIARELSAPDALMARMWHAHARRHGHRSRGAITGLPVALGGLPGARGATGRGLGLILQKILADRGVPLPTQRIAIQGFGEVGAAAAQFLREAQARIVGVSDKSGGLHHENGLNIQNVHAFVERNGLLLDYPEAESISNAELLSSRCDVLILAAAEKQIHAQNADQVQASIVLEGTEGAITSAAEKILETRNVLVVPEILGTAGHVLAGFFEWTQIEHRCFLTPAEIAERFRLPLQNAFSRMAATATRSGTTLRRAALLLAIGRVADALRLEQMSLGRAAGGN